MGYYTNENGYFCWKRDTQDGHGGHAEDHRAEMEAIAAAVAEQKIQEAIPRITQDAYIRAIQELTEAAKVDVETVVQVGFQNGEEIFRDKKTQKIIVDAVMDEVRKMLGKGKYALKI